MEKQENINFYRIKEAIEYIDRNYRRQPALDEVAAHVGLSPYHFQRMFTEWCGVSPKQFLGYISIEHAKRLLKESRSSLFDTAYEVGLSGTGRLHDLFIKIEGMTPGEYKNGGGALSISYSFADSPFGKLLIASTEKGICYMAFADSATDGPEGLIKCFPNASFRHEANEMQQRAASVFTSDWNYPEQMKLHIKGTDFQLKVWETLLKIPQGRLATYGDIARQIGNPEANRAVGTAIGRNPVAYLIPCHRVIQSTGTFGGYMWGTARKTAIIGWEAAER